MELEKDIVVTLVVMSLTALLFVAGLAALLVLSHTRRMRHRAELAELDLRHRLQVMQAEREATEHTLREVGRELHDSAGQLLTVAQMGLNTVLDTTPEDAQLLAARDALDRGIVEVRRLGRTLGTDLWRDQRLADAIRTEASRLERVGRLRAHVEVNGVLPALPNDTSTILFRVFQEVVNNALKHSGADTLHITLDAGPPFRLTIADNGRGFEPATTPAHGGLVNIHERLALVHYAASCQSAPGAGCTWTIQPLPAHGTPRSPGG